MKIKALFFDVANTLLFKPELFYAIKNVMLDFGHDVELQDIAKMHQLISEIVVFPDKTSKEFYNEFNTHFLRAFGIYPTAELISKIFDACTYLPWHPFLDCNYLGEINLPIGIISNWDKTLSHKLRLIKNFQPKWIFGSEEVGFRKPSLNFYRHVINKSGLIPEEIIYVGDSMKLDVVPATESGMNAILIDRENYYPKSNVMKIQNLKELKDIIYG